MELGEDVAEVAATLVCSYFTAGENLAIIA